MIHVEIKGISGIQAALKKYPRHAHKACAIALNQIGKKLKNEALIAEMKRVFDRPNRYTLNSLRLDSAKDDKLSAKLWFKEPNRMRQHYLIAQVIGGQRRQKGFEKAFGNMQFVPGAGAKLDAFGNISGNTILQIMSVLGKLGRYAGDNTNITDRSKKKNIKERDYVRIHKRRGKLLPGIYQRYQTAVGFGAKTKSKFTDRSKSYQKGNRKVAVRDAKTGRILRWEAPKSKIQSIVRARGLRPILIQINKQATYRPRFDFYGVVATVSNRELTQRFWSVLNRLIKL